MPREVSRDARQFTPGDRHEYGPTGECDEFVEFSQRDARHDVNLRAMNVDFHAQPWPHTCVQFDAR